MLEWSLILFLGLSVNLAATDEDREPEVQTVSFVDLERYAGKWYEVARFPTRFQRDCISSTADYEVIGEGRLSVLNTCHMQDGKTRTIQGEARIDGENTARLKVTFDNFFFKLFSWLIKADYWIIDLAEDYSYAAVGSPNRKYLWILSREPELPEALYQSLVKRIEAQGFDTERLIRTQLPDER
jgi:apolipoprotein D and lipocalin family protein